MNAVKLFALGLISGALVALSLAYFYPSTADLGIDNPHWNGLSVLVRYYGVKVVSSLSCEATDPLTSALLIVGPQKPFERGEVEAIRDFVREGGLLIVADDFGTGNQLLREMGLEVRLGGGLLLDPLRKYKDRALPKVRAGNLTLVLNYATVIEGGGFKALAYSSPYSFLDLNLNLKYDPGEPKGPFPVVAEIPYGLGKVVVISDASPFINSMLTLGDNREFLSELVGGRRAILDSSHWRASAISLFKRFLKTLRDSLRVPEVKYTLLGGALLSLYFLNLRVKRRKINELEEVSKKHPEWDRRILEEIINDVQR